MATSGGGIGRPGQGFANRGSYARDSQSAQATLDTSRIRFGAQIDAKLYSDIAEAAAKAVASDSGRDANKATQLRRYFDELVMLQSKVGRNADSFARQEPFIQMLKAKVAYAEGRGKVDANFRALLCHVVDAISDPQTLLQARLFMEAFMAFYKVYGPKN